MKKSKLVLSGIAIFICSILELAQQNNVPDTNGEPYTNKASQDNIQENGEQTVLMIGYPVNLY